MTTLLACLLLSLLSDHKLILTSSFVLLAQPMFSMRRPRDGSAKYRAAGRFDRTEVVRTGVRTRPTRRVAHFASFVVDGRSCSKEALLPIEYLSNEDEQNPPLR